MLDSFVEVEQALARYGDAHRAATDFIIREGRRDERSAFHVAALDEAELFADLQTRMTLLAPEERFVLEWWYRGGVSPKLIARDLQRSARHVYRTRRRAISRLVDLGRDTEFANADVTEFD
jgi:DNA-binding CsgD family transcriptional regulator